MCAILAAVSGRAVSFAAVKASQSARLFWDTEKQILSSKENLLAHVYVHHIFFWGDQRSTCWKKKSLLFTISKRINKDLDFIVFFLASFESVCNIHNLEWKILTAILIVTEDKGHEVNLDGCAAVRFRAWGCSSWGSWATNRTIVSMISVSGLFPLTLMEIQDNLWEESHRKRCFRLAFILYLPAQ